MHRSHIMHSPSAKQNKSVIPTSGPLGPGNPACPGGPCCNRKKCMTWLSCTPTNSKIQINKLNSPS